MSLRKKTSKLLKATYPELFKFSLKEFFSENLISSSSWIVVLPFILLILLIGGYVRFDFLEVFSIKIETAKSIIDRRIGNIASIISITLIVVGFILNNLAVKKSFAFKLLFKHSFLHPIIYFTLGTIGAFVIISLLRDHLNEDVFINLVVTGIYIFIFILFLIAFLFNSIIRFTNDEEILKLLETELLKEGKIALKLTLQKTFSLKILLDLFKKFNLKEYNFFDSFSLSGTTQNETSESDSVGSVLKEIHDINLDALETTIKKETAQNLSYSSLWIGSQVETPLKSVLLIKKQGEINQSTLEKIIKITSLKKAPQFIAVDYFKKELESSTLILDHRQVNAYLSSLKKLYDLQHKHQVNNQKDEITFGLSNTIWDCSRMAIDKNNKEVFSEFSNFIFYIVHKSLQEKSISIFQQYISFSHYYYTYTFDLFSNSPMSKSYYDFVLENVLLKLKDFLRYGISITYKNSASLDEKKEINEYAYNAFLGFSNILYSTIKNLDLNSFKKSIKEFEQTLTFQNRDDYKLTSEIRYLEMSNENGENSDQIEKLRREHEIESQYGTYYRHILKALKYWLFFLYEQEVIKNEALIDFLTEIKIKGENNDTIIKDIIFFRSNAHLHYFQIERWDYMERQQGVVYSPPSPYDWMTKSFFIDVIRTGKTQLNILNKSPEELKDIHFLHDRLKAISTSIEENFKFWNLILNCDDLEDYNKKSSTLLEVFSSLNRISTRNKELEISTTKLESKYIEEFKDLTLAAWKRESRIAQIFNSVGTVKTITDEKIKLKHIGQRTFYEKAKMMFIDGEHHQTIYGMDTMGASIGRWEDSEFFEQVLSNSKNNISEENILTCLNKGIALLKSNDIIPTAIFMSPEFSYKDDDLLNSNLFESVDFQNLELKENDPKELLIGHYDTIPIYGSFSELLINKAVICDFKKAFEMRKRLNKDWMEEELYVNVYEVSDDQAKEKFDKNDSKWSKNEDGIELTEEESITLIKTSVNIDIWSTKDFQIRDHDSFVVSSINTQNTDAQHGI